MATSDDVATVLKSLNEGIQRLEERLDEGIQRLEIYTKEIMGRLLSPTEIAEVEHKVAQIEQPSQPLTAGR